MRGSYFWLDMMRLYTWWLQSYQQKDRLSHLIQNSTSLSAFGSILKFFWREPMSVDVRVILLVGYDKTMYTRINEKIDSCIIKIWWAFRRAVPFWKFLEGTDVGKCEGRTFCWGRLDSIHNGHERSNEKIGSCITKNWRAFRRSVSFWKIFFRNRCR